MRTSTRQSRARRVRFGQPNTGNPLERDDQIAFVKRVQVQYPRVWDRMTAVSHGKAASGRATAGLTKMEGQHKGYPDILLDLPRGPFHGFRIEMKRRKSVPSEVRPEQRRWGHQLNRDGYLTVVAKGRDEAWDQLIAYLQLGEFDQLALPSLAPFRILNEDNYPL